MSRHEDAPILLDVIWNRPPQDPRVYNTIPSIQYTHILVSSNNVYMNISHHSIINIFVKYPSPPQYNI